MAHEITTRKNGKAEMAYVGEKPWHGLGQELKAGASIDAWKEAAGMDWEILSAPAGFTHNDNFISFGDKQALYRGDDLSPLSVVSDKYKVVQPGEILEFFRDLAVGNDFVLNTAGTLFGGKRFWALASIGESACVVGKDRVDGYLLLSTSCDGTLATTARFTTIRVVCNNTLSMAVKGQKAEVTVGHRSAFNADAVKDQLGIARGTFKEFMQDARELAKIKVAEPVAAHFVESLLRDTKTIYTEDINKSKQFLKIMDLFKGAGKGADMASAHDTAWGLVNAVTEFVDFHAVAKTESAQLASAWFGRGDDLKSLALSRALELA